MVADGPGRERPEGRGRRIPWGAIASCITLAWLPDADLLWVFAGVRDHGLIGHRGFTHTPLFAVAVGLLAGLCVRWRGGNRKEAVRLGCLAGFLVGTHGILDALAQDGRGMLFLWPFSLRRFHFPWRPIPDAPVGWALFTRLGLSHLAIEFVYFLPLTLFALRGAARRADSESPRPLRGLLARLHPAGPEPVLLSSAGQE